MTHSHSYPWNGVSIRFLFHAFQRYCISATLRGTRGSEHYQTGDPNDYETAATEDSSMQPPRCSSDTGTFADCPGCRIPLCWILLIAFDLALIALTCAQRTSAIHHEDGASVVQTEVTTIRGPDDVAADAVRFEAIDVFVDSRDQSLAAWQLELSCTDTGVLISGIEGGEHPAFREPPYYDARAINNNRVILAAFSTQDKLPTGRSRVARVHVQVTGPGDHFWRTRLTTAAGSLGETIDAGMDIAEPVH